jgi:hypothetical protein
MSRLFKPQQQRIFLPVRGTNLLMPVNPLPKKKPRFNALLMKLRQKPARIAAETPQEFTSPPEGGQVVKLLWVSLSEGHVGHRVDLSNGETSLCGVSVLNAKPYHGERFCKRCLALTEEQHA